MTVQFDQIRLRSRLANLFGVRVVEGVGFQKGVGLGLDAVVNGGRPQAGAWVEVDDVLVLAFVKPKSIKSLL